MYLTTPLYNPKIEIDCTDPTKFLRLPTRAIPSDPTNSAINFEVKKPAMILMTTDTELSDATLIKTLLFM